MATDIFQQVKVLVKDKGMVLEEAVREIESKLHGKLPDHIISLIKKEVENDR